MTWPTPTQWRVLGYLRQFHAEEDRLPTMDEIARQFGWAMREARLIHRLQPALNTLGVRAKKAGGEA